MTKNDYLTSEELLAIQQTMTPHRREKLRRVVELRQRGLMVVMEDVYNPHNLAAIARSCDAFGVQQITFSLQDQRRFDPRDKGLIVSSSASKWLDYRIFEEGTETCLTTLQAEGWHIMAALAGENIPSLYDVDLTQYDKLAVLMGNEHAGLSQHAGHLADSAVTIPMRGIIESFNVSVATAVILSEITRQRQASEKDFSLPEDELEMLYGEFLRRGYRKFKPGDSVDIE